MRGAQNPTMPVLGIVDSFLRDPLLTAFAPSSSSAVSGGEDGFSDVRASRERPTAGRDSKRSSQQRSNSDDRSNWQQGSR